MAIGRVCVFCGSRSGRRPAHVELARELGEALGRNGLGLVYGGAALGLMGAVADGALAAGGEVIGVLPHQLAAREIAHPGLTELRLVDSMLERKALMVELADAFVALPGGLGTLDELFEVLTWGQLGLHAKPCALLDPSGYFEDLLAYLDHTVEEGFVHPAHRAMLTCSPSVDALLAELARARPARVDKWTGSGEEVPEP